jgi:molecular chaperone HtpG
MALEVNKTTQEFQSDVAQVLELVVHSLYQEREVFLRELLSNAADACDKLRFEALGQEALYEGDSELRVEIEVSSAQRTLTIRDNGIGMTREDAVRCLGTIAHSGTREFLNRLSGERQTDTALIGQFGVGFYSAFMVAERVVVLSRRAGVDADEAMRWESDGRGSYSVEGTRYRRRGTEVILHLREDASEFLDVARLRTVVKRHSDHLAIAVMLPGGSDGNGPLERVNRADAVWLRRKAEVTEAEYQEFYKHLSHDYEDAAGWLHAKVEGKLEYRLLLYVPKRAPFGLWDRDARHGVKLYVKRVFITDEAERLLPRYLRFVRGIVDTDDLPLNISRETLQGNRVLEQIRAAATRRVLGLLKEMSEDDRYPAFWTTFGTVLKEGVIEDAENREAVAALLRFPTTREPEGRVSLDEYLARRPEGQKGIYYTLGEAVTAALANPQLEAFIARGVEVLVLAEPVDEWLVMHLHQYHDETLQSVADADLDLADLPPLLAEESTAATPPEDTSAVCARLAQALGERVAGVRASQRLTQSPCCLVAAEGVLSARLARMLTASGETVPKERRTLEVNLSHPLLVRVAALDDDAAVADWAALLLGQAELVDAGRLDNPGEFLRLLNRLLAGAASVPGPVPTQT